MVFLLGLWSGAQAHAADKLRPNCENLDILVPEPSAQPLVDNLRAMKPKRWLGPEDGSHPWSGFTFTDPRQHSPSHYVYLVHMLFGAKARSPNIGRFYEERHETGRVYFRSASVISNQWPNTAGPSSYGYILKVPPESVRLALPYDLRSAGAFISRKEAHDYITDLYQRRPEAGIFSPPDLLRLSGWQLGPRSTDPESPKLERFPLYNEVLLEIGEKDLKPEIVGFIRIEGDEEDSFTDSPSQHQTWQQQAKEHALPLVEIHRRPLSEPLTPQQAEQRIQLGIDP